MFASLTAAENSKDSKQRIALVAPEHSESLISALSGAGYEVLQYTHPLKALEEIVDNPIKMALVAPELPWMSGAALARTLRDSYNVSEVIIMDDSMNDDAVVAKVRSGVPIERPTPAKAKSTRTRRAGVTTTRTGRRIIVRSARSN